MLVSHQYFKISRSTVNFNVIFVILKRVLVFGFLNLGVASDWRPALHLLPVFVEGVELLNIFWNLRIAIAEEVDVGDFVRPGDAGPLWQALLVQAVVGLAAAVVAVGAVGEVGEVLGVHAVGDLGLRRVVPPPRGAVDAAGGAAGGQFNRLFKGSLKTPRPLYFWPNEKLIDNDKKERTWFNYHIMSSSQ